MRIDKKLLPEAITLPYFSPLKKLPFFWCSIVMVFLCLFVAFIMWLYFCCGSVTNGILFLKGYAIVPTYNISDMGEIRVLFPHKVEDQFVLKNLTSRKITVVGAKVDCSCVEVLELPITLEPFGECILRVKFECIPSVASQRVSFSHNILLYLDLDALPVILTIKGEIVH